MRARGLLALAIVTGGVGLGALLGSAADPDPKRPPEPAWRGTVPVAYDSTTPAAAPTYALGYPAAPRDSYPPAWAHEEITDWEPDYPAWIYSDHPPPPPAPADPPAGLAPAPSTADIAAEVLPPEPPAEGNLDALY